MHVLEVKCIITIHVCTCACVHIVCRDAIEEAPLELLRDSDSNFVRTIFQSARSGVGASGGGGSGGGGGGGGGGKSGGRVVSQIGSLHNSHQLVTIRMIIRNRSGRQVE